MVAERPYKIKVLRMELHEEIVTVEAVTAQEACAKANLLPNVVGVKGEDTDGK